MGSCSHKGGRRTAPSPAPIEVPYPGRVARADAAHRVEGHIEAARFEVPVGDKHGSIGRAVDARKPSARRWVSSRKAGGSPVRCRLRFGAWRMHRVSQRQAPIPSGLNRTQAEGSAAALVAAGVRWRIAEVAVPTRGPAPRAIETEAPPSRRGARVVRKGTAACQAPPLSRRNTDTGYTVA